MLNTTFDNDIRQTFNRFWRSFDEAFTPGMPQPSPSGNRDNVFSPILESAWTDDHLHLRAVVPGVGQEQLKVTLNNNQLVIEGERKPPKGWNGNAYTQLAYGKFHTAVTLPNGLDVEKLACRLHDGILDIQIPVTESRKPRQVKIEAGETQRTLSA